MSTRAVTSCALPFLVRNDAGSPTTQGVDLSYVKDFADLNHKKNLVAPDENQLYVGWAKDGEWCNYTVDVKTAGTYKISALYGNGANTIKFSITTGIDSRKQVSVRAASSTCAWALRDESST